MSTNTGTERDIDLDDPATDHDSDRDDPDYEYDSSEEDQFGYDEHDRAINEEIMINTKKKDDDVRRKRPTKGFEANYHVFPLSAIGKEKYEVENKLLMPNSALTSLMQIKTTSPMFFAVENTMNGRSSYCGVLEFSSDEGIIYMPRWMMENLYISEGDIANLKYVTLQPAKSVRLQPHRTAFYQDIKDYKNTLQASLGNGLYSCLTTGDTITVFHQGKKYQIDVVETNPASGGVSLIDVDCEVEFADALDYVPPPSMKPTKLAPQAAPEEESVTGSKKEVGFVPFAGKSRRLDGGSCSSSTTSAADHLCPPSSSSSSAALDLNQTQLMRMKRKRNIEVDSDYQSSRVKQARPQAPPKETTAGASATFKNKEQSFKPFTGKSFSLMG